MTARRPAHLKRHSVPLGTPSTDSDIDGVIRKPEGGEKTATYIIKTSRVVLWGKLLRTTRLEACPTEYHDQSRFFRSAGGVTGYIIAYQPDPNNIPFFTDHTIFQT